MAPLPGSTAIFYVILIAPGFVAVMTAISLAAIENNHSQFVLLIWSLVTSLIIDVGFLTFYQSFNGPITSFNDLPSILFTPFFRVDYIAIILVVSVAIGVIAALGLLVDLSGRTRRALQSWRYITYNPRQPWENFMRDSRAIRVLTADSQLFAGTLVEWSRSERPKELRIANPYRYNEDIQGYEPVGREDMLFLEQNIERVLMHESDGSVDAEKDSTYRTAFLEKVLALIEITRRWASKRTWTGLLILIFAGWYTIQLIVAASIGVQSAEPWFYVTPDPGTGWVFAPISHNMEDIGHLRRNLTFFLLVGSFAEPYLETRDYLKLFFGLTVVSLAIPVVFNLLYVRGDWLVAGASGGVYGLWAFMGIYRRDAVWSYCDSSNTESWDDFKRLVEALMAIFGLFLIIVVPFNDIVIEHAGPNTVSHVTGILFGYLLATWSASR